MTAWDPDELFYGDDARALEWMRLDDDREREQERLDRVRRDIGENYPKTCPDCGRSYYSAGQHWEVCTGRRAVA